MKNLDWAMIEEQKKVMQDLVQFNRPLAEIEKDDKLGFIWEDQPDDFYFAILTRQDIINVLDRFLLGQLSAMDVYQWAEEVCGRYTLDDEKGYGNIIHRITNYLIQHFPEPNHLITPKDAQKYILMLQTAPYEEEDD